MFPQQATRALWKSVAQRQQFSRQAPLLWTSLHPRLFSLWTVSSSTLHHHKNNYNRLNTLAACIRVINTNKPCSKDSLHSIAYQESTGSCSGSLVGRKRCSIVSRKQHVVATSTNTYPTLSRCQLLTHTTRKRILHMSNNYQLSVH